MRDDDDDDDCVSKQLSGLHRWLGALGQCDTPLNGHISHLGLL